MTNRPSRRWVPVTTTVVLAGVLLVAAIVILPSPGKVTKTTESTTSTMTTSTMSFQTSFATLTTSDYNSSLGLELIMNIAPTALSENDGVSVYASLNNTLATQNNLTRPAGTSLPSSSYETCSKLPVGVAIFRGNYDVDNASQGDSLGLISPNEEVVNGCAGFPNSWSLAPMSNDLAPSAGPPLPASTNATYWGYWTFDNGDVFRPFSPGVYTIEGQDYWGEATFLHFQVVENQNPLDCATIASNSSFVGYTNGSAGPGPLKLDAYYQNPPSNGTVVLALTNTGNSTLTSDGTTSVSSGFNFFGFFFSPDWNQTNTWRYYAQNGTLGYPAFFYPDQCVLISATLSSPEASLSLSFSDNQTQTFTVNP